MGSWLATVEGRRPRFALKGEFLSDAVKKGVAGYAGETATLAKNQIPQSAAKQ
jgi:hypothetical protein